jgi:hypothetical protein
MKVIKKLRIVLNCFPFFMTKTNFNIQLLIFISICVPSILNIFFDLVYSDDFKVQYSTSVPKTGNLFFIMYSRKVQVKYIADTRLQGRNQEKHMVIRR